MVAELASSTEYLPLDQVIHGDALDVLKTFPENSIDALVVDPPAGISFMNRAFDHDKGGRHQWVAWLASIMSECLRVLKPGSHALVWALPRTSHWTAWALEDAGFEIRDCIEHFYSPDTLLQSFLASLTPSQQDALKTLLDSQSAPAIVSHLFGSGMPKSHNVSLAIDKHFHAEREVIGKNPNHRLGHSLGIASTRCMRSQPYTGKGDITAPATPEAQLHNGKGSALKPANEHWICCRKPLAEKSLAENVLRWGTGAINIDKCRIELNGDDTSRSLTPAKGWKNTSKLNGSITDDWRKGRWPSNVLLSHTLLCSPDGCAAGCPVAVLDMQSGNRKSNARLKCEGKLYATHNEEIYSQYTSEKPMPMYYGAGGASRYFARFFPDDIPPYLYTAKASRAERNAGLEEMPARIAGVGDNRASGDFTQRLHPERGKDYPPVMHQNSHPTVKSLSLCRYLLSLITPENGIVLDCFAGSGSTLVAAVQLGYHFIGIEMNDTEEEPYVTIARARVAHATKEARRVQERVDVPAQFGTVAKRVSPVKPKPATLSLWEDEA